LKQKFALLPKLSFWHRSINHHYQRQPSKQNWKLRRTEATNYPRIKYKLSKLSHLYLREKLIHLTNTQMSKRYQGFASSREERHTTTTTASTAAKSSPPIARRNLDTSGGKMLPDLFTQILNNHGDNLQQMALLAYLKSEDMGKPMLEAITTAKVRFFVEKITVLTSFKGDIEKDTSINFD
jgi:hypothetical protein